MYDILELNEKVLTELRDIAKELKIKRVESLRKQDLIYRILDQQAIMATENKNTENKPLILHECLIRCVTGGTVFRNPKYRPPSKEKNSGKGWRRKTAGSQKIWMMESEDEETDRFAENRDKIEEKHDRFADNRDKIEEKHDRFAEDRDKIEEKNDGYSENREPLEEKNDRMAEKHELINRTIEKIEDEQRKKELELDAIVLSDLEDEEPVIPNPVTVAPPACGSDCKT